jgi:hypothetical protein
MAPMTSDPVSREGLKRKVLNLCQKTVGLREVREIIQLRVIHSWCALGVQGSPRVVRTDRHNAHSLHSLKYVVSLVEDVWIPQQLDAPASS